MAIAAPPASVPQMTDRLRIEFLFLDLTTCTRCRGTDRSLESALEVVDDLLTSAGIEVEVEKIQVESAKQARQLRFVSSPTIRVNGRDVALELRESACGSEPCTDGCGDSTACRVWLHRGREYTEPPVEMIVDAIMHEVYAESDVRAKNELRAEGELEPYELPENLEALFRRQGGGGGCGEVSGRRGLLPAGGTAVVLWVRAEGRLLRRPGEACACR